MSRNNNSSREEVEDTKKMGRSTKPGRKPRRGSKRATNSKGVKEAKESGNDPAWYGSDPALLRDSASYPFSYNTGASKIHDPALWPAADFDSIPADQIPGICSLHVHAVVGTSLAATDPINVAAQSVYSFVRHANSGHSNYDASDLMMYILAMANMYSYLVFCQRAYGYALTYDQRNRYLPNDLLRANNIDASDLVNNLANFRFWINTLISKMVSFAVPATMSIFSRMSFMYSDYYIEGTSIKEQLYQYVPEGFYQFGIDSSGLGELTWVPFDYTTLMTTQDLITFGDTMFNAIWSQEDFGIMSGDVLKAYGDRIIKLTSIPEYYNIVPKFDPMVLTQMKNADLARIDTTRISQSSTNGIILQTLTPVGFSTSDVCYGTNTALTSAQVTQFNKALNAIIKDYRILTVDTDNPTPEVVMEATRLKIGYNQSKLWYHAGTEVITKVIITNEPGVDIEIPPIMVIRDREDISEERDMHMATMNAESACRHFHYMPRYFVAIRDGKTGTALAVKEFFDIDNFTILTFEDVKKLHEAATINMFAVPSIGKVQ